MFGIIYTVALVIIVALCVRRGIGIEYRIVASMMFFGSVGTQYALFLIRNDWTSINWTVVMIDAVAAAIFIVIALQSKRHWPMIIAALQIVVVISHFAAQLGENPVSYAIGVLQGLWGWAQLIVLLVVGLRRNVTTSALSSLKKWRQL
jgi:uncharacterized membrane protein